MRDARRPDKKVMNVEKVLHYGTTAKVLHWTIVVLLLAQYALGWIMPDVHRGPPGAPMITHISLGVTILLLIVVRFAWRLTHPVTPESTLPGWQRLSSEAVHWVLYIMSVRYDVDWLVLRVIPWMACTFFWCLPVADAVVW
jgi:cytochrome b561